MKHASIASVIAFALAVSACQDTGEMPAPAEPPAAAAPPPAEPAPPAPEEYAPQTTTEASLLSDPRWAVLFAGHDLTSFDTVGDAQWNLTDGYVEADGYMNSFLVTRGQYTDFALRAEFWPSADANSGIFIRCENPAEISAESCYEINIFDQNPNPDNRTGAIIGHSPPMTAIAAGEQWNTYEVTAEGPRITVRLNGTLVADIEDSTHASGPIALQNNGGLIRIRRVELQPL